MSNNKQIEKICTGCGRSSLNPIDKEYLACCPDNNYVNISSTYFLYEKLYDSFDKYSQGKFTLEEYLKNNWLVYEQAKEMHKEETTITENTSDGYHTFKILYDIRKAYNVALFNEWGKFDIPSYNVHKSRKHHDGKYPFGKDNWFIVCAKLPSGQISNHYPMEDWDLFKIPETEKALFEFDGHTTEDVIKRLLKL